MKYYHFILIAWVLLSLSGCQIAPESYELAHFFWEPKLQKVEYTSKTKRRAWYWFTPSRSGNTKETAVKMSCYNMISGDEDEQHLLRTRFSKATWENWAEEPTTVKSDHRYYHVYHVTEPDGRTHLFWINATDYHDLF